MQTITINPRIKTLLPYVALAIIVGFHVWIRLFPAYFPQFSAAAKAQAEGNYTRSIAENITKKYPDYNSGVISSMIDQVVKEREGNDKSSIEADAVRLRKEMAAKYQNDKGETYLFELDPYHWKRYGELVLKNGYPGDRKKDGVNWDDRILAPSGYSNVNTVSFYYLSAWTYRLVSVLRPDLSFDRFCFYFSPCVLAFFVVACFLLVRTGYGVLPALLSAFLIPCIPICVSRTTAGWYDMDGLSLLLPMILLGLFVYAYRQKSVLIKYGAAFLCAAGFGVFASIWNGWWFVFLVVCAGFSFEWLNRANIAMVEKREELSTGSDALWFAVFVLSTALFAYLFASYNIFSWIPLIVKMALRIGASQSGSSVFPETFYTVGELRSADIGEIAGAIFGPVFFLVALVGVFSTFMRHRRSETSLLTYILVFWFLAMLYASTKGFRFVLFLSVPVIICFSVFFVDLSKAALTYAEETRNKIVRYVLLFIAAFSGAYMVHMPAFTAYGSAVRQYPLMDDTWYGFLTQIKDKTQPDAIIMSWWDFGDWYKTVAQRRVTFDGQSQHTQQAHWMGKALTSDDMGVSRRLFSMMRRAPHNVYSLVNTEEPDEYRRYALFERYFKGEQKATKIVEGHFGQENKAYVIVEQSMLPKMGAISFLGNWDVAKLYLSRHADDPSAAEKAAKIFGIAKKDAEKKATELLFAEEDVTKKEVFSTRYSFGETVKGKEDAGFVYFDNGAVCASDGSTVKLFVRGRGYMIPSFVSLFSGKDLVTKHFTPAKEDKIDGGFVVVKDEKGAWTCTSVSHEAATKSLFARLYFYGGFGVDFVEPIISDKEHGMFMYRIKSDAQA